MGGRLRRSRGYADFIEQDNGSTRALLSAVLGQAVRDLNDRDCAKNCWPALKINAAKWILGIGKDHGTGVSIDDVAEVLDVDAGNIARIIGAEEKLERLIQDKKRRSMDRVSPRRTRV